MAGLARFFGPRPRHRSDQLLVDFLIRELGAEWLIFSEVDVIDSRVGLTIPTDADLILAHPDRGFCFVECKSGKIRRSNGSWEQLKSSTGQWHSIDPMKQALRAQRAFLTWCRNAVKSPMRSNTKFIPSIAISVFSGCARPSGNTGPVVDGSVIWADEIEKIPNLLNHQLPRVSQAIFDTDVLVSALFGDVAPTEWDLSDDPGKVLLGLSTIGQEIEQLRQSLENTNQYSSTAVDELLQRIGQLESDLRNDEGERRLAEIDSVLRQIQLSLASSTSQVEVNQARKDNRPIFAGAMGALAVLFPVVALLFIASMRDSSADEVRPTEVSEVVAENQSTFGTSTSSTEVHAREAPVAPTEVQATPKLSEGSTSGFVSGTTTLVDPAEANQVGETFPSVVQQSMNSDSLSTPRKPSKVKKVVETTIAGSSPSSMATAASQTALTPTSISSTVAAKPIAPTPAPFKASGLALGAEFSCGIDRDTNLASCWGGNSQGYLGDGSQRSRSFASRTSGNGKFRSLVAGSFHACGIDQQGTSLCWGMEQTGRSGGSISLVPTGIAGDHRFTALYVTRSSTCGIAADMNAWCWGDEARPVDFRSWRGSVEAIEFDPSLQISEFSGGGTGGCFRESSGVVQCWSIRDNYLPPSPIPLDESFEAGTLSGYSSKAPGLARSAGAHACGKTVGQSWLCWGSNDYGQLGTFGGESDCLNYPGCIKANTLSVDTPLASITSGSGFSCGIDAGGAASCWGRNDYGQLGRGYTTKRLDTEAIRRDAIPAPVNTPLKFAAIRAGFGHVCGIVNGTAEVWCWGNNSAGQLGNLSRTNADAPVRVLTK
jgi:hypothetical protein